MGAYTGPTQCPNTTLFRHGDAPPATLILAGEEGYDVLVDGDSVTPPVRYDWEPGSVHTIETTSVRYLGPTTRLVSDGWNGGGIPAVQVVAPEGPAAYRTDYSLEYHLDVHTDDGGTEGIGNRIVRRRRRIRSRGLCFPVRAGRGDE